jgi:polyhydroxyalkanoate synthase
MSAGPLEGVARFWRTAGAVGRMAETACRYGQTPRDPVAVRDGATLFRYRPTAPAADAAPLLIVHGLIGRAEVVDIDPDRSLIRSLLARGFDCWMIHWGKPGRAERWLRFEDYALDRLGGFVADVRRATGRRPVVMGICEGGLFALCLAALQPEAAAGLVLAVTPVDCHADPTAGLTRLVRSFAPETLAALIDHLGGLPGAAMGAAFQDLTPSRTLAKYTADLVRIHDDPDEVAHFLRMERWLADRPDHPAEAAKQLLIDIYHDNALAEGRFLLDGQPVRLSAVTAPSLAIWGARDHLVPPACARGAAGRIAGPYGEVGVDAGHIGVFVSRRAGDAAAEAIGALLTDQAVAGRSRV